MGRRAAQSSLCGPDSVGLGPPVPFFVFYLSWSSPSLGGLSVRRTFSLACEVLPCNVSVSTIPSRPLLDVSITRPFVASRPRASQLRSLLSRLAGKVTRLIWRSLGCLWVQGPEAIGLARSACGGVGERLRTLVSSTTFHWSSLSSPKPPPSSPHPRRRRLHTSLGETATCESIAACFVSTTAFVVRASVSSRADLALFTAAPSSKQITRLLLF